MISYGRQCIDEEDINAVIDVLRSDFLTQGSKIGEFEKALCEYTGSKYCVAVANGTAALHLAVAALDISPGSSGITTDNTFVASANCMVYNGMKPLLADIDTQTYNISLDSISKEMAEKSAVLIPVHFAGQPCDMKEIFAFASAQGMRIIEDASHAIGSMYRDGDIVGSCKYSDITTFSFHPVKTITTGEGGAITTNSEEIYNKLLMMRSHGITRDPAIMKRKPKPWYYEMQRLGYNYRLTEIQAALGISQLKRVSAFKRRRREIVQRYNSAFSGLEWITIPEEKTSVDSCFHLYVVLLDFDRLGITRDALMNSLALKGIGTQVHYIPVHMQPYYEDQGIYSGTMFPNALWYYERALSLPIYPKMTNEEQDYVIEQVYSCLRSR